MCCMNLSAHACIKILSEAALILHSNFKMQEIAFHLEAELSKKVKLASRFSIFGIKLKAEKNNLEKLPRKHKSR